MRVTIEKGLAVGTVAPPPSKSYAHRALICSALANGTSILDGISNSVDMQATLECISALGASYEKNNDVVTVTGGVKEGGHRVFNCHESGSTLRFFIPIALLDGGVSEFKGTERLMSRGIGEYEKIFEEQGIKYKSAKSSITLEGRLTPGCFKLRGDISSQFISGLLFALPLLNGDSTIELTSELESKAYVDITIDVLSRFGILIKREGSVFIISGNQRYRATDLTVERDASNAAFLEALNLLGADVSLINMNEETIQPDGAYKDVFKRLKEGTPTIDLTNTPDLAPIAFAMAGYLNGATFLGTRRLKIKESDRAEAMKRELSKLGCCVTVNENSVTVKGGVHAPNEIISSHNDHRIAMAMAVLLTALGGTIDGCEAVSKSYPDFFEVLGELGIKCKMETEQ